MSKFSRRDVLKHLGGNAKEIGRDITAFAETAKVLSSDHPRLIDQHPSEWVGLYHGQVAVHADSFESLMEKLEEAGIPRKDAIIRFIDKEERTLIL